jgi:hypothetical protein
MDTFKKWFDAQAKPDETNTGTLTRLSVELSCSYRTLFYVLKGAAPSRALAFAIDAKSGGKVKAGDLLSRPMTETQFVEAHRTQDHRRRTKPKSRPVAASAR